MKNLLAKSLIIAAGLCAGNSLSAASVDTDHKSLFADQTIMKDALAQIKDNVNEKGLHKITCSYKKEKDGSVIAQTKLHFKTYRKAPMTLKRKIENANVEGAVSLVYNPVVDKTAISLIKSEKKKKKQRCKVKIDAESFSLV